MFRLMSRMPRAVVFALTAAAGLLGLRCSDDPAPAVPVAAAGSAGSGGNAGSAIGGSGGAAGMAVPSPPLPAFVGEYAALRLKIKVARCDAKNRVKGGPGEDCWPEAGGPLEEEIDALLTGRSVLHPENAPPCIAALEAVTTGDALSIALDLCANAPLAVGTLANGEPCGRVNYGELTLCKDGYCANTTGSTGGLCQPRKGKGEPHNGSNGLPAHNPCATGLYASPCTPLPIAIGGACEPASTDGTHCIDGSYCDKTTKRCKAYVLGAGPCATNEECRYECTPAKTCATRGASQTCYETVNCDPGLRCLYSSPTEPAQCEKVDASRCDPLQGAARCASGEYCPLSGKCAPLPTATAGKPCVDGRCGPGLMCSTDVCVVPAEPGIITEGAACDGSVPCSVAHSLVCSSGKCQRVKHLGEACNGGGCDSFTFCGADNTCQTKGKVGTSCTEYVQCWGECATGTCQSPAGGP